MVEDLTHRVEVIFAAKDIYFSMRLLLSEEEHERLWLLYGRPKEVLNTHKKFLKEIEVRREHLREELFVKQCLFIANFKETEAIIKKFAYETNAFAYAAATTTAKEVMTRLEAARVETERFNRREELFNLQGTDYECVIRAIDNFIPILDLWNIIALWMANKACWHSTDFHTLVLDDLQNFLLPSIARIDAIVRSFQGLQGIETIASLAKSIRQELDDFSKYLPVVGAINHPGMTKMHWEGLESILRCKIESSTLCIQDLINVNVLSVAKRVCDLGHQALQEHQIEQNLLQHPSHSI